jgi:hypothetical protein
VPAGRLPVAVQQPVAQQVRQAEYQPERSQDAAAPTAGRYGAIIRGVPDSFEPSPEQDRRMFRRAGVCYLVAALLLLAVCCYGAIWFRDSLNDLLSNLN